MHEDTRRQSQIYGIAAPYVRAQPIRNASRSIRYRSTSGSTERFPGASAPSDLEVNEEVNKDQNPDIAKAFATRSSDELRAHYKMVG